MMCRCLNCDEGIHAAGAGLAVFDVLCHECINAMFMLCVHDDLAPELKVWLAQKFVDAELRHTVRCPDDFARIDPR